MSSSQYRVTSFPARAYRESLQCSLHFSADQNGTSQLHFLHISSWRAARVPTNIVKACMRWPSAASPQAVSQQVASLCLANTSLVFPGITFKKISARSTAVQWQSWICTQSKDVYPISWNTLVPKAVSQCHRIADRLVAGCGTSENLKKSPCSICCSTQGQRCGQERLHRLCSCHPVMKALSSL